MEALVLALLMLAAVLLSSVIDQLVPKVSSPLIQIGLGLLIALFAPSQINITLDPDLFLVLFIAPLLFDEAKNVDKGALWKNRRPVLSLAIGLVVVTALIIGFAVEWLEPSIGLFAAFALGAALGPTDAVAVASLSNFLFRNAPAVVYVAAERADDAGLAAQNIELMAAAQGLGVLFNGYLCRASEELPAVRAFLGADERPLQMCLLLGCPAVSYPRTAPRMPGDFVVK